MRSVAAIVVCCLAGCSPLTVQQLRQDGYTQTDTIGRNYQLAFEQVLRRAKECFAPRPGIYDIAMSIDHYLLNEHQRARITGKGAPAYGFRLLVELQGTETDRTRVTVWVPDRGWWPEVAPFVLDWARGDDARCGYEHLSPLYRP